MIRLPRSLPWVLLLATVFFIGCGKQGQTPQQSDSASISATPIKEGQGKGIIRGIDTAMKTVTIDAGTVPGIMDAMTMDYKVEHPEELHGVAIGDSITFTLQDRGEGNFMVTAITPLKKQ